MSKRNEHRLRRKQRKERRTAQRRLGCRNVPSELRGEAQGSADFLAAAEGDEDAPERFRMVLYNGGRMRPSGFFHDVVVDLSGLRVAAGKRPSYLDHDRRRIVGHLDSVTVGARQVTAEGVVSGAGEAAREVLDSSAKGFPWKSSLGGQIQEIVFVERGEKASANGRNWQGPCYVVRAMLMFEGSFVSLAGDNTSSAKIAARAADIEGTNIMNFEAWLKAKGFGDDDLTDAAREYLQAQYDAEIQASLDDDDPDEAEGPPRRIAASGNGGGGSNPGVSAGGSGPAGNGEGGRNLNAGGADQAEAFLASLRKSGAAEHRRQSRIRELAAEYNVARIRADGGEVDFVAHAIEQGWDVRDAELTAMRSSRPQNGPARATREEQTLLAQTLEAALCLNQNIPEEITAQGLSERAVNEATTRRMRAAGIQSLCYEVIRAAGGYVRPGQVDNDFIRATLRADAQLQASGFATVSVSGILGNVANKRLMQSYRAVPNVIHRFCDKASNKDFKPSARYRLTGDAMSMEVGADGELKSFDLGEEGYSNQLATFGRIIALTRTMIMNDDLGAFLQIPKILGRGAGLARNKA
ncbi:MAG: hypothetical protein AAF961_01235, partial [Planctomycetota bacterium]